MKAILNDGGARRGPAGACAVLLLTAAVFALCACGDGGTAQSRTTSPAATLGPQTATIAAPSATPGPAAASTGAAPPLPADLTSALLLASEVGAGWSDVGRASTRGDTDQTRLCGVSRAYKTVQRSRAQFSSGAGGSVLDQTVTAYVSGDARRVLDDNAELLRSCLEWRDTAADGSALTFRLEPLMIPALGDQSVALRIDIDRKPLPAQLAIVLIRRGDLTTSLLHTSTGETAAIDQSLMERLARRADERLAALAR